MHLRVHGADGALLDHQTRRLFSMMLTRASAPAEWNTSSTLARHCWNSSFSGIRNFFRA